MNLKDLYGTESRAEIFNAKHHKRQDRAYAAESSRVTMSPDECKALCEAIGLEYLAGYEARVLEYTITNETPDRYGDIVRAVGVDCANYLKNPVVLFAHDYPNLPVGNTIKLWCDQGKKEVKAWALFFDDRVDATGRADTVFKFASNGAMKGCSIGFNPIEAYRPKNSTERAQMGLGEYGVEYRKCELLEFSPCSVPANPDALRKSMDERAIKVIGEHKDEFSKYLDQIDKLIEEAKTTEQEVSPISGEPEDTVLRPYPNEHAARLISPDKFDEFRRTKGGKLYNKIDVPATISIIWGHLKGENTDSWAAQALRFPTKSWTEEEAKKWLADNEVKFISFEKAGNEESAAPTVATAPIQIDLSPISAELKIISIAIGEFSKSMTELKSFLETSVKNTTASANITPPEKAGGDIGEAVKGLYDVLDEPVKI